METTFDEAEIGPPVTRKFLLQIEVEKVGCQNAVLESKRTKF